MTIGNHSHKFFVFDFVGLRSWFTPVRQLAEAKDRALPANMYKDGKKTRFLFYVSLTFFIES